MSTRTWDSGANDGVFGTAANWSADTAPVDTDTAIISSTSKSIVAGDYSSIELAALRIWPGYGDNSIGVSIGGSGSTLKIDATELEINNARCSFIRLEGIYDTIYASMIGGAQVYFGPTSDIGTLYAPAYGQIEIDTGAKLGELISNGASVLIRGDTSTPDDLIIRVPRGCVVECQRRVKTAYVEGTLRMTGAAEVVAGSGSAEIHVTSTGTFEYQATGTMSAAKIVAMPGAKVDGSKAPGGSAKVAVGTLVKSQGANVNLPTRLFSVSATIPLGDESNIGAA